MPPRKKFVWTVKLQAATGELVDSILRSYWSPAYEGIKEVVGSAAAALAWSESEKRIEYIPVLVEGPIEMETETAASEVGE